MKRICNKCCFKRSICIDGDEIVCGLEKNPQTFSLDHECHIKNGFRKESKNKKTIESVKAPLLLPIKPKFASLIYLQEKRFELRKRVLNEDIDSIVLYETGSVGKITGVVGVYSEFEGVIKKDKVNKDWFNDLLEFACIDEEWFNEYFKNKKMYYGYLLNTEKIYKFDIPLPIEVLKLNKYQAQMKKCNPQQIDVINYLIRKGY